MNATTLRQYSIQVIICSNIIDDQEEIMSYQISKYEAIKAVLKAEESDNIRLVNKMMQVIRRAARYEIKKNSYTGFYILSEQEKKYFENTACNLHIIAVEGKK